MCDPVTAGLLLSAAGGGAKFVNNQGALNRQDRQTAEGIRRQGNIQRNASSKVDAQIEDIATSDGTAEKAESLDGFLNALRATDDSTTGALPTVPGANQRFAENVEAGKSKLRTEGNARASRLSRIDAPRFQRINEQGRVGATASALGEDARQSRAEDFLTQLRVASERPNEFIDALGSVLQGGGSALALRKGKGGGGSDKLTRLFNEQTIIDSPVRAADTGGFA